MVNADGIVPSNFMDLESFFLSADHRTFSNRCLRSSSKSFLVLKEYKTKGIQFASYLLSDQQKEPTFLKAHN
jgi:hypothetical protein